MVKTALVVVQTYMGDSAWSCKQAKAVRIADGPGKSVVASRGREEETGKELFVWSNVGESLRFTTRLQLGREWPGQSGRILIGIKATMADPGDEAKWPS